jgi:hypothetical protein
MNQPLRSNDANVLARKARISQTTPSTIPARPDGTTPSATHHSRRVRPVAPKRTIASAQPEASQTNARDGRDEHRGGANADCCYHESRGIWPRRLWLAESSPSGLRGADAEAAGYGPVGDAAGALGPRGRPTQHA